MDKYLISSTAFLSGIRFMFTLFPKRKHKTVSDFIRDRESIKKDWESVGGYIKHAYTTTKYSSVK